MEGAGVGRYRIAKLFEVESGHCLSKHPERCRFPHGHSRTIEIVLSSDCLDEHDMVCDYKALKLIVETTVSRLDHALAVNSSDPRLAELRVFSEGLLLFEDADPTTEVMVRWLYNEIRPVLEGGGQVTAPSGAVFEVPRGMRLERVRMWETSTSWAEYEGP
jgi:6-pyruvoyltetrahydropterin/6-carboxytetrahydropterin synthase